MKQKWEIIEKKNKKKKKKTDSHAMARPHATTMPFPKHFTEFAETVTWIRYIMLERLSHRPW